jgi:hypothetical protein
MSLLLKKKNERFMKTGAKVTKLPSIPKLSSKFYFESKQIQLAHTKNYLCGTFSAVMWFQVF